jgi:molybdate transport system ATP-binding protein
LSIFFVSESGSLLTGGAILACDDLAIWQEERLVFAHDRWVMKPGERWAIIGPNGAGKSLLAAALAGKVPFARSELILGTDRRPPGSHTRNQRRANSTPVFLVSPQWHREVLAQESSFYQSRWHTGFGEGQLTVARFLSQEAVEGINPFEVARRMGPRRDFLESRQRDVRSLGIEPLWRRKLICLSHGEMRKVLLTHALLHFPRWLILDDPFGGLDVATRARLRKLISRLIRQGVGILVVTNRLEEIPTETTHLLLVHNHRIVAQGERDRVLQHPVVDRMRTETERSVAAGVKVTLSGDAAGVLLHAELRPAELIVLRGVTIKYGQKPILRDLYWTIRAGEHWALSGPNGAGKSTLLSVIQVDNPQAYAQDIRLFGASPDSTQALWKARQRIGWMSSELHLHHPLDWSVMDIVCSGYFNSIGLHQRCSPGQRQAARVWLGKLELGSLWRAPFGDLSLAEQRIVLLARAVVKRPWLLILDEPCQGLDGIHRHRTLTAVEQVVAHSQAALIYVTHHSEEIPPCVTHLLRLRQGRVVFQGRLVKNTSRRSEPV